jgi:hypothetical protein
VRRAAFAQGKFETDEFEKTVVASGGQESVVQNFFQTLTFQHWISGCRACFGVWFVRELRVGMGTVPWDDVE